MAARAAEDAGAGGIALLIDEISYPRFAVRNGAEDDVRALARALEKAGFTVIFRHDLYAEGVARALDEAGQMAGRDRPLFLYWSGFASSSDGILRLFPTGADPSELWLGGGKGDKGGMELGSLLRQIAAYPAKSRLVVIDGQKWVGEAEQAALPDLPPGMAVAVSLVPSAGQATPGLSGAVIARSLSRLLPELPMALDESLAWARVLVSIETQGGYLPSFASTMTGQGSVQPSGLASSSLLPPLFHPFLLDFSVVRIGRPLDWHRGPEQWTLSSSRPEKPYASSRQRWEGSAVLQQRLDLSSLTGDNGDYYKWYEQDRDGAPKHSAEFELGALFAEGKGAVRDFVAALKWYRRAAEHGDVEAEYRAGMLLKGVEGVPRDESEAQRWFRKAAEQGHAAAMTEIGLFEVLNAGNGRSSKEAMEWFQKAAALGNVEAMHRLALGYATGDGVVKNCVQARDWLTRAADRGREDADRELHSSLGGCSGW
jgi:TPR repeat protein